MEMVNIKINGVAVQAPAGSTIIEAAHYAGIDIPSLCYLRGLNEIGACRICVVEVKGARTLVASCVYPINEGMEVFTNSPKVLASRKMTLEIYDAGSKVPQIENNSNWVKRRSDMETLKKLGNSPKTTEEKGE